ISDIFVSTLSEAAQQLQLSQAFIGFILVALAGGAAEMYSAIHAASVNRPELSVAIALGSSTQISLFVAPVLVVLSYFVAPLPMNLHFSSTAVLMVLLSTLSIITILSSRFSTWYTGVMLLSIYTIFALTLYLVRLDG
ncbi:MAG TPA: cation transporter, partial [Pseudomonadales bacterium]|nr:cation transporter [Pseudomonadales bacterium]